MFLGREEQTKGGPSPGDGVEPVESSCQILYIMSDLEGQHGTSQICTSKIGGSYLNNSLSRKEHYFG